MVSMKEDQVDVTLLNETLDDASSSNGGSSPPMGPPLLDTDPSVQCIEGVSWAGEMEILQPHEDGNVYGSVKAKTPTRIVKVLPETEAFLSQSSPSKTKNE